MESHKILACRNRGFTSIEVLVVLAILLMMGGFTSFMGLDAYRSYSFRNEKDIIISALQRARSQAMNNICLGSSCVTGSSHGVHFESDRYIIFQGSSYATRDVDQDEVIFLNYGISFDGSTITDVVFDQLLQNVGPVGTIKITDTKTAQTVDIIINSEGRITWTN